MGPNVLPAPLQLYRYTIDLSRRLVSTLFSRPFPPWLYWDIIDIQHSALCISLRYRVCWFDTLMYCKGHPGYILFYWKYSPACITFSPYASFELHKFYFLRPTSNMGLGALTLCAVENVPITYCPPLVYTVQFFHACDFACVFNHGPGSTVVFTVEKKKSMYKWTHTHGSNPCCSSINCNYYVPDVEDTSRTVIFPSLLVFLKCVRDTCKEIYCMYMINTMMEVCRGF